MFLLNMYSKHFKPLIDIIIASIGFIVLIPLIVIIMLILFFANSGKSFFVQSRPGKGEKPYKLIKFRTMNNKRDDEGVLLPDEKRLSKIGVFIRKTSLDEIPQLINVIKGEMSLVGPRPLLEEYLPLYDNNQKKRHDVKPGITGWAQINGRNAISWKEKFELDIWYVENISFLLDLKILWFTFWRVIKREGISQEGNVTMNKFTGRE